MPHRLTPAQVAAYRRDGYLFPLPAFTRAEAARYRAELVAFELRLGGPLTAQERKWRSRTFLLFGWAQELARHPAILDVIEDLIGRDIVILTSTFFIKEPGAPDVAGWHQDAAYFGLDPNDVHVTAWVALSETTPGSGCMQMLPGSYLRGQLAHGSGLGSSVNAAGQYVLDPQADGSAADIVLEPGQFSLHNSLTVHQSGPNASADRRIGIGISYMPASTRHTGSQPVPVHLVRGSVPADHRFQLEPAPGADFDSQALAVHDASYKRFRVLYAEQMERHAARFGVAIAPGVKAT